ncbi:putative inorganic phosphate transporter 1-5 [Camellia lanceoleosa]|uniref:Inorganic phosphate transporter 1-5 n=1 Tax=Camellia lanceoleosa TaxID=1840588 RepID=A0ACC0HHN6_9ERIC|nr:putative inorganic phosphate transporter 1-5 [Camellia lanceoleosa]
MRVGGGEVSIPFLQGYDMQFDVKYGYFNFLQSIPHPSSHGLTLHEMGFVGSSSDTSICYLGDEPDINAMERVNVDENRGDSDEECQTHGLRNGQEAAKKGIGFIEAFTMIGKQEGIKGYWKGNLPQVIRVIPYSAVQLFAYETYKLLKSLQVSKLDFPYKATIYVPWHISRSGKVGAIVGAFGFLYAAQNQDPTKTDKGYPPVIGVRNALMVVGGVNFLGMVFTFLVPESKGKSLEEISQENEEDEDGSTEMRQQTSHWHIKIF